MVKTAEPSLASPSTNDNVQAKPQGTLKPLPLQALHALASLRITVVLFMLALALVFFGTLAMIDQGILSVVKNYFRSTHVWIPFNLLVQFAQVFFEVSPTASLPGSFLFPGGWLIGGAMLVNLLAAHIVRFKATWKRSGILALHAGLIVLFAGEWVTGKFAVEGQMRIKEGEWANYVTHVDKSEVAVIDYSDPKADHVVAVPGSLLTNGGTIQDEKLPFDIEVKQHLLNSALKWVEGSRTRPTAVGVAEVSGTSSNVNMESAVLVFRDKATGQVLADDFLVSYFLVPAREGDRGKNLGYATVSGENQAVAVPLHPVRVNGKEYEVSLRMKRSYKPYSIYLKDFRFDRYMGTSKPRNFSSEVRLVDPETGEDRTVLIRMNEPMMHRGEAFYQSSFDAATEEATVLQVVRDPGKPLSWLSLPYAGCFLVSLGMCLHFGLNLKGFLERRTTR